MKINSLKPKVYLSNFLLSFDHHIRKMQSEMNINCWNKKNNLPQCTADMERHIEAKWDHYRCLDLESKALEAAQYKE